MSALPRHPSAIGYGGLRMTAQEFLSLGETEERLELIDGVIWGAPSPSFLHQEVTTEVVFQAVAHGKRSPGTRVVTVCDVQLSPSIVYRPDVAIFVPGKLPDKVDVLEVPPDLAVEILSPSSEPLDLITKREDDERFGVGEYWVIDPTSGVLRAWQRPAPSAPFAEVPVTSRRFASAAVPGFVLDLDQLRR